MIVCLTGPNSFALNREAKQIIDEFVAEHGDLALERIDGQEAEIDRINESMTSLPFLSSKKLVVLRSPSTNKQFLERVEQIIADVGDSTDVIIVEPKLDKRLSYYKFLKSQTDFREFNELDINGLASWCVATAKSNGGNISPADARYLVDRVGLNQLLIGNELEKLLLHSSTITRADIDNLTEATPQSTIFELLEAAFAGNAKKALHIYEEQRALKVEPAQIIAMLSWQINILAVVKTAGERSSDQIAREAKISPYVVGKSQSIARNITLSRLHQLISDLLDIDIASKSTSIDSDEALKTYLIKLAS